MDCARCPPPAADRRRSGVGARREDRPKHLDRRLTDRNQ